MPLVRLNKHLADLGLASRRGADELIVSGQVYIDGVVADQLGAKIDPDKQKVTVSGQTLSARDQLIYLALHKPTGYTTSNQPTAADPRIVLDLVDFEELRQVTNEKNVRIWPVGRLDKDTTGLLLLTNDGVLTYRLTHPSQECEKEYEVELSAPLTAERIRKIEAGVRLERAATKPVQIRALGTRRARVILTEGKNRQVRKIFGKVGCEVLKLSRVRIKTLELGDLPLGHTRLLTQAEVQALLGRQD